MRKHYTGFERRERKRLPWLSSWQVDWSLTGGALMVMNSLPHLHLPKKVFCLGWPNTASKTGIGQPKGRMISASWHKSLPILWDFLTYWGSLNPSCHHIPALGEWDQHLLKTNPTEGASLQPRNEIKEHMVWGAHLKQLTISLAQLWGKVTVWGLKGNT